jgi:predicted heme/steroid binding protein
MPGRARVEKREEMTMSQRRGGIISLQLNGEVYDAKGSFSYNLGRPLREAIMGADGPHGFKETPQVGFIEGAITDRAGMDLDKLLTFKDGTVTLELANGKVVLLSDAYYAGEGTGTTEEGEIPVRFEGKAEEV